ncbi:MAG: cation acetate symporter [Planctomycetota bacterium]|nr:cation acetate symporter [Planctomycetota bacterium]
MTFESSWLAIAVFVFFVGIVLAISFRLGSKAKSAKGYYAAHGEIPWFINGIAFAGDYLSAASFLGICGLVAFYGYDGFLYSIGYLAGWVVALFVIAEPLKRMGRFTFADALDQKFNSRGIKLSAAISTLAVSIFYLIPQMVGAGTLVKPLLGLQYWHGVVLVGAVVILIVVTAGMMSTTYVQFIKGSLLVIFCFILVIMILYRGLQVNAGSHVFATLPRLAVETAPGATVIPPEAGWKGKKYERIRGADGVVSTWRVLDGAMLSEAQTLTTLPNGKKLANGRPQGHDASKGQGDLYFVGQIAKLAGGKTETGPVGPIDFITAIRDSTVILWPADPVPIVDADGSKTTVYFQNPIAGSSVLKPGGSPSFKGVRGVKFADKLNFLSLMLALFGGTASLPHILIRYYTVKDQAAARKSTVVGIASIGFFYILTLFLGLGAMTSGMLDPSNNNMSAPLLAKTFGALPFAVISAIAFTTVLGTVSGLIMAASGAVAHDLMSNVMKIHLTDHGKVVAGRVAAVFVGIFAMWLGIKFEKLNVTFLVGWAFSVAASANLPSLIMLLFWKRTTKQGITAAIIVGMLASLTWILMSGDTYRDVYGLDITKVPPLVPFSQPGIVTIPLGFLVLIVVSLLTQKPAVGFASAINERQAVEDAEQREPGEA